MIIDLDRIAFFFPFFLILISIALLIASSSSWKQSS